MSHKLNVESKTCPLCRAPFPDANELNAKAVLLYKEVAEKVDRGETSWHFLTLQEKTQALKATSMWIECAEQGLDLAMYNLGYIMSAGHQGRRNKARRALCYRQAARLGHKKTKFCMGLVYMNSDGVELRVTLGVPMRVAEDAAAAAPAPCTNWSLALRFDDNDTADTNKSFSHDASAALVRAMFAAWPGQREVIRWICLAALTGQKKSMDMFARFASGEFHPQCKYNWLGYVVMTLLMVCGF